MDRLGLLGIHLPAGPSRLAAQALTDADRQAIKDWHARHHWHPHQLRHNAATELRKEFGLETARIILGHRSVAVTTLYAEQDRQKALEAMERVG